MENVCFGTLVLPCFSVSCISHARDICRGVIALLLSIQCVSSVPAYDFFHSGIILSTITRISGGEQPVGTDTFMFNCTTCRVCNFLLIKSSQTTQSAHLMCRYFSAETFTKLYRMYMTSSCCFLDKEKFNKGLWLSTACIWVPRRGKFR